MFPRQSGPPTMLRLDSPDWRLWIDPASGGQWLAAEARRGERWLAIMPDCRGEEAPLGAANFHMLPYSNRIRDGRFTFAGETVQLAHAERHAIHGALRKLPWETLETSPSTLHCRIDSRDHEAVNWPWAIVAELEVRLEGRALATRLTLTNASARDMPAGLGWHPYFVREIDGASPELTLPVAAVYPDANGDCLPDGAPVALPAELDFREPRTLRPTPLIDRCLSGLSGPIRIAWPDAALALELRASAPCDHLVFYNPDAPWFAVEPVTNANDAFNLAEAGVPAGRAVLGAGESLSAEMTLTLL